MDGKISEFLKMQHDLAVEKGWIENRTPEHAPLSILWSIDELGEAIAIIKKKGGEGIMNNESVRAHFVEEVADTFMYLFDMMESYGITADEFTGAYVRKYEKNLGRNWHENDAMYENCMKKLIIFDMEGTVTHEDAALPWTERLLEILSKTGVKLALLSDLEESKIREKLNNAGLSADTFDLLLTSQHYTEAFEKAAQTLGAQPAETVVCTSSVVGIKLAKRSGMAAVAVPTHFGEAMYQKAGADFVTRDLLTLTDLLAADAE